MSIIYDALQKTQKKRELKSDLVATTIPANGVRMKILLMLISILIAAVGFFLYFPKQNTVQKIAAIPHLPKQTVNKHKFVLQGVFTSDKNKMAMINNQMYQLGDMIEDMKIIHISDKIVKLRKGSDVFTLSLGLQIPPPAP